jgi:ABC-2 type transport system ATP-binding protein
MNEPDTLMKNAGGSPASEPAGSSPAIEVRNLSRWFPGVHAVRDISFTVEPGQVIGFVGANGAGKTTTMRILATLDHPSSGEAFVCGHNVVTHPAEVRRCIGWMPDHYGTYDHMTVLEYLDFFARALGFEGEERIERIAEVMEFTDLTQLADRLIDALSKGMGQRLCLGRALLHDPEVLILDEPAAGLDPKARVELKHLIRLLAHEGKTVLISSHILSELGEMCDSLLFINQGRVIHHGSAGSLRRGNSEASLIEVQLAGGVETLSDWASLSPHVTFREATKSGGRIEIDSVEPAVIASVLRRMIDDGIAVTDFHLQERKLEDAFIEILGKIEASGTPIVS